jgi:hypothetical protein
MGWRGKLLFAMIVYAAGFLTAIYVLAPSGLQAAGGRNGESGWQEKTTEQAWAQTPVWAASVREGMSKVMSFAEEQSLRLAETIKTQLAQSTLDTSGE